MSGSKLTQTAEKNAGYCNPETNQLPWIVLDLSRSLDDTRADLAALARRVEELENNKLCPACTEPADEQPAARAPASLVDNFADVRELLAKWPSEPDIDRRHGIIYALASRVADLLAEIDRTRTAPASQTDIPLVHRPTGRTIPDLTGREHLCEYQRGVKPAEQSTALAEAVQWTKEPPKCEGRSNWFWYRIDECHAAKPVKRSNYVEPPEGEWWPVPIPVPAGGKQP